MAPKAMEEKLQEECKPLQKLLLEDDCVHLGLLTKERTEAAARSAVGRTRRMQGKSLSWHCGTICTRR